MRHLLRTLFMILCAVLLLGNSQCQNSNSASTTTPDFQTSLAVQDANGNSATEFSQGEQIQFVVSVHNYNPVPLIVLAYNCIPPVVVVVEDTNTSKVVFQGSFSGAICLWVSNTGIPTTVATPGQTATFYVTWNQLGTNGEQAVAPGSYEEMAFFVCLYPGPSNGPTGSYDPADCQAANTIPPLSEITPSAFRSALMLFTIQ